MQDKNQGNVGTKHSGGVTAESPRPAQGWGEPLFRFVSFGDWVGHATQRFQRAGVRGKDVICLDTDGHICKIGRDFMAADVAGAFPVTVYRRRPSAGRGDNNRTQE